MREKPMVMVEDYFSVRYGTSLDLTSLEIDPMGINFVSRTERNNGVSATVKLVEGVKPIPGGTISVAGSGNSVMESSFQSKPYYTGYHVFYLTPKIALTEKQLFFYCLCLKKNRFRFGYGRQANKTLSQLRIPSIDEIPSWVGAERLVEPISNEPVTNHKFVLQTSEWGFFEIKDLFQVKYGVNVDLAKLVQNSNGIPYVSRTAKNNGVSARVEPVKGLVPIESGTISVAGGGSVLECFVQDLPYYSGRDLYYLKPKERLTSFTLLFVTSVIRKEKYRFNYGRQANRSLPKLKIKLPVDAHGRPNWRFMEDYIKSLPGSVNLREVEG
jgi:hypothetical protein